MEIISTFANYCGDPHLRSFLSFEWNRTKNRNCLTSAISEWPSGFENVCEDESGVTMPYVLHAEANAITKVARSNNSSDGATLYITASPCMECSKLIIQAGIRRVVFHELYRITDGIDLLRRANVECVHIPDLNN